MPNLQMSSIIVIALKTYVERPPEWFSGQGGAVVQVDLRKVAPGIADLKRFNGSETFGLDNQGIFGN